MAIVMNVSSHVQTLTVGVISPRETRNVDTDQPVETALIDDGILIVTDAEVEPPSPPVPFGTFRGTVAAPEGLPASGNRVGDIYLVLADDEASGGALLRYWDGDSWEPLAGGAGNGGGGGEPDTITFTASLAGIEVGQPVTWDSVDARFEPGALVPE